MAIEKKKSVGMSFVKRLATAFETSGKIMENECELQVLRPLLVRLLMRRNRLLFKKYLNDGSGIDGIDISKAEVGSNKNETNNGEKQKVSSEAVKTIKEKEFSIACQTEEKSPSPEPGKFFEERKALEKRISEEKKCQIKWIENEIHHLNVLRELLEKQSSPTVHKKKKKRSPLSITSNETSKSEENYEKNISTEICPRPVTPVYGCTISLTERVGQDDDGNAPEQQRDTEMCPQQYGLALSLSGYPKQWQRVIMLPVGVQVKMKDGSHESIKGSGGNTSQGQQKSSLSSGKSVLSQPDPTRSSIQTQCPSVRKSSYVSGTSVQVDLPSPVCSKCSKENCFCLNLTERSLSPRSKSFERQDSSKLQFIDDECHTENENKTSNSPDRNRSLSSRSKSFERQGSSNLHFIDEECHIENENKSNSTHCERNFTSRSKSFERQGSSKLQLIDEESHIEMENKASRNSSDVGFLEPDPVCQTYNKSTNKISPDSTESYTKSKSTCAQGANCRCQESRRPMCCTVSKPEMESRRKSTLCLNSDKSEEVGNFRSKGHTQKSSNCPCHTIKIHGPKCCSSERNPYMSKKENAAKRTEDQSCQTRTELLVIKELVEYPQISTVAEGPQIKNSYQMKVGYERKKPLEEKFQFDPKCSYETLQPGMMSNERVMKKACFPRETKTCRCLCVCCCKMKEEMERGEIDGHPRHYFLRIEEAEIDDSVEPPQNKPSLEVVTVTVPIKRAGRSQSSGSNRRQNCGVFQESTREQDVPPNSTCTKMCKCCGKCEKCEKSAESRRDVFQDNLREQDFPPKICNYGVDSKRRPNSAESYRDPCEKILREKNVPPKTYSYSTENGPYRDPCEGIIREKAVPSKTWNAENRSCRDPCEDILRQKDVPSKPYSYNVENRDYRDPCEGILREKDVPSKPCSYNAESRSYRDPCEEILRQKDVPSKPCSYNVENRDYRDPCEEILRQKDVPSKPCSYNVENRDYRDPCEGIIREKDIPSKPCSYNVENRDYRDPCEGIIREKDIPSKPCSYNVENRPYRDPCEDIIREKDVPSRNCSYSAENRQNRQISFENRRDLFQDNKREKDAPDKICKCKKHPNTPESRPVSPSATNQIPPFHDNMRGKEVRQTICQTICKCCAGSKNPKAPDCYPCEDLPWKTRAEKPESPGRPSISPECIPYESLNYSQPASGRRTPPVCKPCNCPNQSVPLSREVPFADYNSHKKPGSSMGKLQQENGNVRYCQEGVGKWVEPKARSYYEGGSSRSRSPEHRQSPGFKTDCDPEFYNYNKREFMTKSEVRKEEEEKREKVHQLPLQEYLAANRPDFCNNAEKRRQIIAERTRERIENQSNRINCLMKAIKQCNQPQEKKRIFTSTQMREQTNKRYRKLPEVTGKIADERKKEEYKTNRLMADIFAKKIQCEALKGRINLSNSVIVLHTI